MNKRAIRMNDSGGDEVTVKSMQNDNWHEVNLVCNCNGAINIKATDFTTNEPNQN